MIWPYFEIGFGLFGLGFVAFTCLGYGFTGAVLVSGLLCVFFWVELLWLRVLILIRCCFSVCFVILTEIGAGLGFGWLLFVWSLFFLGKRCAGLLCWELCGGVGLCRLALGCECLDGGLTLTY